MTNDVVVLGGGFAGVAAAFAAADRLEAEGVQRDVGVTLVDIDGKMTLRPRLYEECLSDVEFELGPLLARRGIDLILGCAEQLRPTKPAVRIRTAAGPMELTASALVVATGSSLRTPPIDGAEYCWNVDSATAARALRDHLRVVSSLGNKIDQSIVVVGAGLAGVEVAANLAATAPGVRGQATARVHLVDPRRSVELIAGSPNAGAVLAGALEADGVNLILGSTVVAASPEGATLADERFLSASTVVWTGGLVPSPLIRGIGHRVANGRVAVTSTLAVEGYRNLFMAGDVAAAPLAGGRSTVMSCQHAIPTGLTAGYNAAGAAMSGALIAFEADLYVTCVSVGAAGAILTTGWDRQVAASGTKGAKAKSQILDAIDPRGWPGPVVPSRPQARLQEVLGSARPAQ